MKKIKLNGLVRGTMTADGPIKWSAGEKKLRFLDGIPQDTMGMSIPYNPAFSGSTRTTGDVSPIILSTPAKVLDEIFSSRMALGKAGDVVFVRWKPVTASSYYYAKCTTSTLAVNPANLTECDSAVAVLATAGFFGAMMASDTKLGAMAEEVYSATKGGAGKSQKLRKVFNVCDALNYSSDSIEIEFSTDLTVEEVNRGIQTGLITPVAPWIPTFMVSTEASGVTKKQSDLGDVLERAKKGEFAIPFSWDFDQREYIPSIKVLETYVPTALFGHALNILHTKLCQALEKSEEYFSDGLAGATDYINMMFFGDPAGGKTITWKALAAALQIPYYVVIGDKYTEDDAIEGKNKVVSGEIQYVPGEFVAAFERGGIVVLEDANLWPSNVLMGALGQALESPYCIWKDGYERTSRHKLCVIGTNINPGAQGTNDFNEAFQSRFRYVMEVETPSDDQFVDVLCIGHPELKQEAKYIHGFYQKLQTWLRSDEIACSDIAMSVSLRACQGALDLIEFGFSIKEAIKNAMVNHVLIKNPDLKSAAIKCLDDYPDFFADK